MEREDIGSLLAAAIRMYGKDDHLIISREVFESLPARMGIEVLPMGDDNSHIVLHVRCAKPKGELTEALDYAKKVVKPNHLTLVK